MWRPAYRGGTTVAFAQHGGDLPTRRSRPRVVYLQNASDPIVWWSPELVYREPAWLDETPRPGRLRRHAVVPGGDVLAGHSGPVVSTEAPAGHGHTYRESIADGWAALLDPPGWTDADTARLRSG